MLSMMAFFLLLADIKVDLFPKKIISATGHEKHALIAYLDNNLPGDLAIIDIETGMYKTVDDKRFRVIFPVAVPTTDGFFLISTMSRSQKAFRHLSFEGEFSKSIVLDDISGWEKDFHFYYLIAYEKNKAIVSLLSQGNYVFADLDLDKKVITLLGSLPVQGDPGDISLRHYFYKIDNKIFSLVPKTGKIALFFDNGKQTSKVLRKETEPVASCGDCIPSTVSFPITYVNGSVHVWWEKAVDRFGNKLDEHKITTMSIDVNGKQMESARYPLYGHQNRVLSYHFEERDLLID